MDSALASEGEGRPPARGGDLARFVDGIGPEKSQVIPRNADGRAIDEQFAFLLAGIDGLFTDQPDVGILARSLGGAA